MKKISRFNGLNIRRGVYLENSKQMKNGVSNLRPKIIFKKGIGKDNYNNATIPLIFIGKFTQFIKSYLFEINVTLVTDEEKYINNLDNLEAFNDIADIILNNMKKPKSIFVKILSNQVAELNQYFSAVQTTEEFNLNYSIKNEELESNNIEENILLSDNDISILDDSFLIGEYIGDIGDNIITS